MGILDNHRPAHKLQFISLTPFGWPRVTKATPIAGAPTYFTDDSDNGKAGITGPEERETPVTPIPQLRGGTSSSNYSSVQSLSHVRLFATP